MRLYLLSVLVGISQYIVMTSVTKTDTCNMWSMSPPSGHSEDQHVYFMSNIDIQLNTEIAHLSKTYLWYGNWFKTDMRHKRSQETWPVRYYIFNFLQNKDLEYRQAWTQAKESYSPLSPCSVQCCTWAERPQTLHQTWPDNGMYHSHVHTLTTPTFKTQCNRVLFKTYVLSPWTHKPKLLFLKRSCRVML